MMRRAGLACALIGCVAAWLATTLTASAAAAPRGRCVRVQRVFEPSASRTGHGRDAADARTGRRRVSRATSRGCPTGEVLRAPADYEPNGLPSAFSAGRRVANPGPDAANKPNVYTGFGGYYSYALRSASLSNADGISGELTVGHPWVDSSDPHGHSLGELMAETNNSAANAKGQNVIQLGWAVDRSLSSDGQPRLFVFHWINGQATCYNACGFVQTSSTIRPGMALTPGKNYTFKVQQTQNAWWLALDGHWFGYLPDSLWTAKGQTFTSLGNGQWVGEVEANRPSGDCTQMGTGAFADHAGAAVNTDQQVINSNGTVTKPSLGTNVTDPSWYTMDTANGTWGGSGPCADTVLRSAPPAASSNRQPSFTYGSDESGVHYQCRIDSGAFTACPAAGFTASPLPVGQHTFAVRAVTAKGVADPTPATSTFTVQATPPPVDTTPPALAITHRPPAIVRSRAVRFAFTATGAAHVGCAMDGHTAKPCSGSVRYARLAEGRHTFTLLASDTAGNKASRAVRFTVDTVPVALSRKLTGMRHKGRTIGKLHLRCSRACTVRYHAAVQVRGGATVHASTGTRRLRARRRFTPSMRLTRTGMRKVAAALRHHRRPRLVVTVSATDGAGVTHQHTLRLRLRRA